MRRQPDPTIAPESPVGEAFAENATPSERVGPYLIQGVISHGGMGEVLAGYDPHLERTVAIKRIRGAINQERAARFLREAKLQANLVHPGIVRVYEVRSFDGVDYIVSEFVEGNPLETLVFGGARPVGLPLPEVVRIATEVAEAIDYAHRMGVVHRDVKVENVLIGLDGAAKLTDFGISHSLRGALAEGDDRSSPGASSFLASAGRHTGTPRSMSPEQSRGEPTDARSDWFSFGVMLYEMLCAVSPFLGHDLASTIRNIRSAVQVPVIERRPGVPAELSALIDQLLEKQPAERATVTEIRRLLRRVRELVGETDARHGDVETSKRQVALVVLRAHFDDKGSLRGASMDNAAALLELHASISAAVEELGGTLLFATGNQVAICVGHPLCHDNNCERAAALSLELQARVDAAAMPLRVCGALELGLVTIVSGDGKPKVLGELVDDAISLCAGARAGELLVGPAVRSVLAREFEFEFELGSRLQTLASKRTIPIVRLVGRRQHADRIARVDGPPLAGRERHWHSFERAWTRARAGRGQALLVLGDAGLGKTRLIAEWLDRVDVQASPRFVSGAPERRYVPYGALRELFATALKLDDVVEPTAAQLERGLEALELNRAGAAAALAVLFNIEAHDLEHGTDARRVALVEQLAALVLEFASRASSMLVVEDLNWVDHSSVAVLRQVASRVGESPVLMIMTARSELRARWDRLAGVEEIELTRLDGPDSRRVVEAIVGAKLPVRTVHAIVEHAEGNPLLLEEFARALGARALELGPGDDTLASLAPSSLRDSVQRRLDGLGPARRTLEFVSLLGREAPLALLRELSGLSESALVRQLDEARVVGLLTSTSAPTFRHALVRDAVAEAMGEARRRGAQERIVEVLGAKFAALVETDPEVYVHHFEAAGELERAFELRVAGGTRAARRMAYAEASRHLQAALDLLGERPPSRERARRERDLIRVLCLVEIAINGWSATSVKELYERGKQLDAQLGQNPALGDLYGRWVGGLVGHDVDGVDAVLVEIAGVADTPEGKFLRDLTFGVTAFARGELGLATERLESACATLLASLEGRLPPEDTLDFSLVASWSEEALTVPLSFHAVLEIYRGRLESSARHQAVAEGLTLERNALYGHAYALGCHVVHGFLRHDPAHCEAVIAPLERLCSQDMPWLGYARALLSMAKGYLGVGSGDPQASVAEFRRGIRIFAEMGAKMSFELHAAACADLCRDAGDLDAAQEQIDAALEVVDHEFARLYAPEVYLAAARLARARGQDARAQSLVSAARAAFAMIDAGDEPLVLLARYLDEWHAPRSR